MGDPGNNYPLPPASRTHLTQAHSEASVIPFPSSDDLRTDLGQLQKSQTSPSVKTSPDSQTTSSSKQTSSDKLSALPISTTSTPAPNRFLRSPISATSHNARVFRRSLDTSVSLPSFATADFDSPLPLNNVWNTAHNLNTHLNAGAATLTRPGSSLEGSVDKDTPKQRVSFDSDRGVPSAMQGVRQALSRIHKRSDPVIPSPALRSSAYASHRESQKDTDPSSNLGSRSPSHSRSRAASPLRLFQQWSSGLHRSGHRATAEEPFIAVDPFKLKSFIRISRFSSFPHTSHDLEHNCSGSGSPHGCNVCGVGVPVSSIKTFCGDAHVFMTDTLPRQVYLNLLLRLPAMYFSRVARIFEDAEVSRPDIQRMIDAGARGIGFMNSSTSEPANVNHLESTDGREGGTGAYPPMGTLSPGAIAGIGVAAHVGVSTASVAHMPLPFPDDWTPPLVSPALIRFKHSWEAFIDSLLREWKTLNLISALLLSAILTMFQIPSAEGDPVTRTAALLSLICAIMSLSYGCMYIVRFGTMRSMYRASKWAEEAQKTKTSIWWNVWVLLAMPAVWMAWSMVLFITSILCFLWRTGSETDPDERPPLSMRAALGPRIAVTAIFGLGMVYFAMIVKTLKSYGTHAGGMRSRGGRVPGGADVGASGVGHGTTGGLGSRAREMEAAMDRRGRERERSVSRQRRREEAPERRRKRSQSVKVVMDMEGDKVKGLNAPFGLGLTGLNAQGKNGSAIVMDLEKVDNRSDTE